MRARLLDPVAELTLLCFIFFPFLYLFEDSPEPALAKMAQWNTTLYMPLLPVEEPPFTVEAPGVIAVPGETIPRRHPKAKNGLITRPSEDVSTSFELLKRSAEKYRDEPAVGSRKLIQIHKEKKSVPAIVDGQKTTVEKEWTYYELSGYSYLTYAEYEKLVLQLGAGLRKLGLVEQDKLHICASTW
jgi:long-chain acyl-CoA synthetase